MKLFICTGTLGILVLSALLPCSSAAGQRDLVRLRVSVFNGSPVLPSTLEVAERDAGLVLRYAGIQVNWLNCPQDAPNEASHNLCTEASFPTHLHLRIEPASRGLKPTTVGISFLGEGGKGCYADLFYEAVQQLQDDTHASPSVILGHAMAHELGHLLLGANSHSPAGLMRARWTREDLANAAKGNLRFSPEESLRISNRLAQAAPRDSQTVVLAGN